MSINLLLRGRKVNCGWGQECDVREFRVHAHTLKVSLLPSTASDRCKILIVEVHADFIEIRLESDRLTETKVVRLRPRFIGKTAHVGLRVERTKCAAAKVPCVWGVDRPDVDVLLLS